MISFAFGIIIGVIIGTIMTLLIYIKSINSYIKSNSKWVAFYWCLYRFVRVKQAGQSFGNVLKDRGIKTVAIYGMKELGELVLYELLACGIEVKYGIDKDADSIYSDVELVKLEDELKPVDMIIVTVLVNNDDIIETLKKQNDWEVVTVNNLLNAFDIK